jgi:hypothetical protein
MADQDETEPVPVTLVATCRTPGCPSKDQPFPGIYYANAEPPTYRGLCMGCSQPVTDLVPQ